jgi:hypothetical protein
MFDESRGRAFASAPVEFPVNRHVITMLAGGFLCSCGERGQGRQRPTALASQHQLAALMTSAMNGEGPLVTNCLECNSESSVEVVDDAIAAYAAWLRAPCAACGMRPLDVAGGVQ